jgi:WD40 repeat protein
VKAHIGAVNALHSFSPAIALDRRHHKGGTHQQPAAKPFLLSGGRDGVVRLWNTSRECVREFVVDALIDSQCPIVRSIAFSPDGNSAVVGTRGAEIFELLRVQPSAVTAAGNTEEKEDSKGKEAKATSVRGPFVEGHGDGEVCALATHPTKTEFVTAGDDETIR